MKNEPAFPTEEQVLKQTDFGEKVYHSTTMVKGGLTKREYFAIKIYQSLLVGNDFSHYTQDELAYHAVKEADMLIETLQEF